ncbi:hypothetical protein GGQ86_002973 [Xanthobacter flavus]|uniref:Uncharacterized protein n=1 Tax=Xanthobacter flavus TaxID=281 RepID=A0A9W6FK77_XANFL|nr:hypothetical protein [Xanthobacter flavus]MDR6334491.1 hypothetical protein [Xanthobacter flavus]GLI23489.1 hypothetical protein XFLAVUS301_31630 [Xanthobacter flavus]
MAGQKFTNAGTKIYVCATEQTALPLNQAAFQALTYVEIKGVGNRGDFGADTNIVNYDTFADEVTQKAKGITDAGNLDIEVARLFDDAGQVAMRAAALTKFNYAIKIEFSDAPSDAYDNTVVYCAGIITGPVLNGGGVEDFVTETYTVGFNQLPVTVEAALS